MSDRDVEALLVREYAIALCDVASATRVHLESAIDALTASRDAADEALDRCRRACELAERWSVFAARAACGNAEPSALRDAAEAIAAILHPSEVQAMTRRAS